MQALTGFFAGDWSRLGKEKESSVATVIYKTETD